jgi:hypothetical protein
MSHLVERLLDEQLEDGGWNCDAERGSRRSSFATTINVLEGLLAYERPMGSSAELVSARTCGEDYLLERSLFRRNTTRVIVDPAWTQFSFPNWWHYDMLRGLDYFFDVGGVPNKRLGEAVELLRWKRHANRSWLLENTHLGKVHFQLEEGAGAPSRWDTLRSLHVLRWFDGEFSLP